MAQAYRVRVKSSAGKDEVSTLQVLAEGPEQAVAAVRSAVGTAALIEVDEEPISGDRAVDAGFLAGKILLG